MAARLYCPLPLQTGAELNLPAQAARHVQVLRLQPGDAVELFHGGLLLDNEVTANLNSDAGEPPAYATGWFEAVITRMGRSDVAVRVGDWHAPHIPPQPAVHIACGVPANERMDWLVEKAAELGAGSIQPLLTRRSVLRLSGERALKRVAHWQAIAVSACEQSGRTAVPWVRPLLSLDAFLQQGIASRSALASDRAVGAAHEPAAARWVVSLQADAQPLRQALQAAQAMQSIWLLSGPEGGLDDAEEALAMQQGWTPVSLGACTLRAETAPVAALAAWSICREPIESQGR